MSYTCTYLHEEKYIVSVFDNYMRNTLQCNTFSGLSSWHQDKQKLKRTKNVSYTHSSTRICSNLIRWLDLVEDWGVRKYVSESWKSILSKLRAYFNSNYVTNYITLSLIVLSHSPPIKAFMRHKYCTVDVRCGILYPIYDIFIDLNPWSGCVYIYCACKWK